MYPYIIVLMVVSLWVGLEEKTINKRAIIIPLLMLMLLATIRYYSVGTDAEMYSRYFRFPFNKFAYQFDPDVERGYQYLVVIIREIYNDYFFYFFIMSIVCIFPVLFFLKEKSVNYTLSVYIYITFGLYFTLYNQIRQSIAMGICFYATKYLLKKEFIKFAMFIIIAAQFHVTALIMLGMYFLCHFKLRIELKALMTFLVGVIAAPAIIAHMALNNSRYEHYTEQVSGGSHGMFTVGLYALIAIFIYIYGKQIREDDNDYKIYECLYICGVSALFPIAMLGTDPAGPQRIVQYFVFYIMLILPIIFLRKLNNIIVYTLFIVLSFSYFIMMISSNIAGIYPYKINPVFDLF
ncbi:EpsG family protein [Sodalis sp. RH16]|uniref:EpsG family protein n=1 Tax=Sodalis sp. RH16 TaxID=3394331 RepID=UPI0039B39EBA